MKLTTPSNIPSYHGDGILIDFRKDVQILFVLTLFALIIRLYNIGALSLWIDEAASLTFSRLPWLYLWGPISEVETNPPGYYSILKIWMSLFGMSDASVRVPSAIAGALCIIPAYLIALRQHGRSAAVTVGLLLAASAIQVRYSQEARSFTFVTLFFLLGLMVANKIVEQLEAAEKPLLTLLFLTLCCSALPYLHNTGFLVVFVTFVYLFTLLLLKGLLTSKLFFYSLACSFLFLFITSPVTYWTIVLLRGGAEPISWIPPVTLEVAYSTYSAVFGYTYLPTNLPSKLNFFDLHLNVRSIGNMLIGLTCGLALVQAIWARQLHVISLVVSFISLVLVFFLISQAKPILIDRVVVFGVPVVLLLVTYGLVSRPRSYPVALLFIAVLAFQLLNTVNYFRTFQKEQWREVIKSAHVQDFQNTAIILGRGYTYVPVMFEKYWSGPTPEKLYYYSQSNALTIFLTKLQPSLHEVKIENFCEMLSGFDAIMLIGRNSDGPGYLWDMVAEIERHGGTLLETVPLNGVTLKRWSGISCLAN